MDGRHPDPGVASGSGTVWLADLQAPRTPLRCVAATGSSRESATDRSVIPFTAGSTDRLRGGGAPEPPTSGGAAGRRLDRALPGLGADGFRSWQLGRQGKVATGWK